MLTKSNESQPRLDWDFYLFVSKTLLGYSMDEFLWTITPNHLLKQFIMWLKYNHPDGLKPEKQIYTLDQTPFL